MHTIICHLFGKQVLRTTKLVRLGSVDNGVGVPDCVVSVQDGSSWVRVGFLSAAAAEG